MVTFINEATGAGVLIVADHWRIIKIIDLVLFHTEFS
jgi:hypothetical protein